MPEIELPDLNGKTIRLEDFRGKYLLVDFWASWCAPCRKENPNFVKAYSLYRNSGFDILGISLDGKKEDWQKAILADDLTWSHVSDLKAWEGKYVKEFGIMSIPTNFLLNREGKIIAKDLRGEELERKLSELFKN